MDHFFNKSKKNFTYLIFKTPPFLIHLCYFVIISSIGFLFLSNTKTKNTSVIKHNSLDVFFTSVSAVAVSSMSTIEMEVFSNSQLLILTLLMFFGSEIFTSMLYLQLKRFKLVKNIENTIHNSERPNGFSRTSRSIEIAIIRHDGRENSEDNGIREINSKGDKAFRLNCIKILTNVILCYLFLVILTGFSLISIYMILVQNAGEVLKNKGLNLPIFSVFSSVSTFTNCGFIPTNENMIVFKKNPGLLLILIPQLLSGNTMYPVFLFLIVWVLKKITKKQEFSYMLRNPGELEYDPLFPGRKALWLAVTVFGFILVQFVMFCSLEWNSEATVGMSSYEKFVGFLFEGVTTRHAGESIFDLSVFTPAILVMLTIMMYFPPYTLFSPKIDGENVKDKEKDKKKSEWIEWVYFSHLSYLVIFIILICITEKDKMKEDPLNFNVFNITFEVISAYGNVGLSIGYSCARQIKSDNGHCKDAWFGFAGRWTDKGKIILILVMFFGRLKNFGRRGGKAWKLS